MQEGAEKISEGGSQKSEVRKKAAKAALF
jgi:hypothetical protein